MCQFVAHVLEVDQPFAIVAEKGGEYDALQRFIRVGYFNIKGYNGFEMSEWKGQTYAPHIKTLEQLDNVAKYLRLDVRNKPEWQSTGVFEGSRQVALPNLKKKVQEG